MEKKRLTQAGDKLYNVKDIFGNIHTEATVISTLTNTVTIRDLKDNSTWVVSKIDLNEKIEKVRFGRDFDLRACQAKWQRPENQKKLQDRMDAAMNGESNIHVRPK